MSLAITRQNMCADNLQIPEPRLIDRAGGRDKYDGRFLHSGEVQVSGYLRYRQDANSFWYQSEITSLTDKFALDIGVVDIAG